jgi:hypothetical protein
MKKSGALIYGTKKILILINYTMFSITIKNTILFILIILIFHFLLKNMLLEKSASKTEPFIGTEPKPKGDCDIGVTNTMTISPKQSEEEKMKEFVALGCGGDGKSLDDFFKGDGVNGAAQEVNVEACKLKLDDTQLPLSNTCDANIHKLDTDPRMKIVSECDLKQDKKDVMLLREYENENPNNGGSLYDGLSAYDALDVNYLNLA